ncbi:oligoribonuclease [Gleimia hominis]|uniref:Oligoribonuclease n=1 Tax=Gleimia hominis TaxID=595468 RepID=A0ABU3IAP2_9ACTO|nr:oligoribonuclease [Gleimia hominis]MDT3767442.1 oligoribonuclease [Gleimia hominis]
MSIDKPLVWIDCEMTGLDLEHDALIEVAVVVTDAQLNIVDPGIDVLIKPSDAALDHMGDFVRKMHTSSGLLEDLADGIDMEQAQAQVLQYIKRFVPRKGKGLLAGNTIGTDKMFLERDMPEVIDHLHYRVVDVSSLKELAKRWFHRTFEEAPEKHGGHRALADIRESIQELEYYRRVLFPRDEGPTREQCREVAREVEALGITRTDQ